MQIKDLSLEELWELFPITFVNNVWIGGGAIIMQGVIIEDNVVIGAGSIVTKDIPSNMIAYGNPCRIMRENN